MTPEGVIGNDGDMPWRLSQDLRRFKRLTMGGALLMGRKTYESIGKPLPGRRTIVITRNQNWQADGVDVAHTPESAVALTGSDSAFVVGGAQIYQLLMPQCEHLWLTRVWSNVPGDTELNLDIEDFRVEALSRIPASRADDVPTEFFRMKRRKH